MQKHTKNYMESMGFDVGDWIPCEVCGAEAIDTHHITPRSLGGCDEPENLIALCRTEKACHDKAESGEFTRDYLYGIVRKRMGRYEDVIKGKDRKGKMKKRCEFCGKMKKTAMTQFVGNYCIECHTILIQASKEAIAEIKSQGQG